MLQCRYHRLKKNIVSRFLKTLTDGAVRQLSGTEFQSLGSATEKRRAAMSLCVCVCGGGASRSQVERIEESSTGGGLPSPTAFIPERYLICFCIIMYFYSLPLYFNDICHRLVDVLLSRVCTVVQYVVLEAIHAVYGIWQI